MFFNYIKNIGNQLKNRNIPQNINQFKFIINDFIAMVRETTADISSNDFNYIEGGKTFFSLILKYLKLIFEFSTFLCTDQVVILVVVS